LTTTNNSISAKRTAASAGVEFVDENGGGLGVRLRKHQRRSPPSVAAPRSPPASILLLRSSRPAASPLSAGSSTCPATAATIPAGYGARESAVGELADGETSMTAANDLAVRRALEMAGVEFIDENGGGPGVRLRNPSQRQQRA